MPIEDLAIGKPLGFEGRWDLDELDELLNLTSTDDIVYVVGTHVGTLLVPLAKKANKIIGYEANPTTYWHLETNIMLNHIENATIYNLAVGDSEKKIKFYQNTINTGGSKIKPLIESKLYNYDNPNEVKVNMIGLNKHIAEQQIDKPTCMIMDIEGSEYFALQGMKDVLTNLNYLYIEYIPHHLKNVSGVTNEDFMSLITPHFSSVKFIREGTSINISESSEGFISILNKMFKQEIGDDLLFIK